MRKPCRWITNPLPWESDVSNDDEVGLFSEEADEELLISLERRITRTMISRLGLWGLQEDDWNDKKSQTRLQSSLTRTSYTASYSNEELSSVINDQEIVDNKSNMRDRHSRKLWLSQRAYINELTARCRYHEAAECRFNGETSCETIFTNRL
ncbi:hypothetical protein V8E54_002045 [Elaphomyces granulatus]